MRENRSIMSRLHLLRIMAVMAMLIASEAYAQPAPASRPTAQARRGPISSSPRDKIPFTNSNLANIKADLPTLFIAGDSTAATGDPDHRGWAAILVDYFDTSKVNLVNRGIGGARFNSYIAQGAWKGIVDKIKPGDFVAIQFGQNSGPLAGIGEETQEVPGRGGAKTTMHTHGWYLRQFIHDVQEKKGIPIAMTLTLRNYWSDGRVERLKEITKGAGGMSDWTRQVAAQEKVLLIDHSNIIGDRYDALGKDAVAKYFAGAEYLHTDTEGAIVNCEAFIAGLKAIPNMPLVDDLNEKGKAIPAYQPAAK